MTPRAVSPKVVHHWVSGDLVVLRLADDIRGEIVEAVETRNALCIALADGRVARVSSSRCGRGVVTLTLRDFKNSTVSSLGTLHGILDDDITYGSDAWIEGQNRHVWSEPLRAVARAVLLPKGTLRNSVGPVLAVDVCGRVWTGSDLSARNLVANLEQAPARVHVSSDGSIAVIAGQLHAAVAIHTTSDNRLCVDKGVIPAFASTLTRYNLRVDFFPDGKIQMRDTRAAEALEIERGGDDILFRSIRLGGRNRHTRKNIEDAGAQVGELLNGIERAGALEEALEERGRRAEDRLIAFNSALLFALRARGDSTPISCTFSGAMTPAIDSPVIHTSPAWVGVNAFVNANLRNRTLITVGDGWNLRLSVQPVPPTDTPAIERTTFWGQNITKQMSVPLPVLPAEGEIDVSFPIVLESHAPLIVSLEVYFVVPGKYTNSNPSTSAQELNFTVVRDVVLDVFTFSTLVKTASVGVAHQRLRASRIRQALSGIEVSNEPLPLSCRLHLPVVDDAIRVLTGRRRTLLGADFSVDKTEGDITLRTTPVVLPFLRAAVLRRCLKGVQAVEADGIEMGERWERRVVDAADSVAAIIRDADRAVAECRTLVDVGPELYALNEDVAASRRAEAMLEKATAKWRLGVREVWRPNEVGRTS